MLSDWLSTLIKTLVLLPCVALAAPDFSADFELGTPDVGNQCTGADAWDDGGDDGQFSTIFAATGSQSCQNFIDDDNTGFGEWGGFTGGIMEVGDGEEVWYSLQVYNPSPFLIDGGPGFPGHLKFLRIRERTSGDAHVGYADLYWNPPDMGVPTTSWWIIESMTTPPSNCKDPNTRQNECNWNLGDEPNLDSPTDGFQAPMPNDEWITWEIYLLVDSTVADGRVRLWRESRLVFEKTMATIAQTFGRQWYHGWETLDKANGAAWYFPMSKCSDTTAKKEIKQFRKFAKGAG